MLKVKNPFEAIKKFLYDSKYKIMGNPFKENSGPFLDKELERLFITIDGMSLEKLRRMYKQLVEYEPEKELDKDELTNFLYKKIYFLGYINAIFKRNNFILKKYVDTEEYDKFMITTYYDIENDVYKIEIEERNGEN